MPKLTRENHHWWPRGLSDFWKNDEGCVHWLLPNGEVKVAPPKNFGMIANGHQIRFGSAPGEWDDFDHNFEGEFQNADNRFPALIRSLQNLRYDPTPTGIRLHPSRYRSVEVADRDLIILIECMISLAVRSPMNREAAVGWAEQIRGPLTGQERNTLIALNMQNCQKEAVRKIGIRGKFAILFSPDKEFLFGDGFYHNIRSPVQFLHSPVIAVPLTPRIAAIFCRPMTYMASPRFCAITISPEEANIINHAVQVHSKDKLFYRSEMPVIDDAYRSGKHLIYSGPTDPVKDFTHTIPGIPERNTSLDFLHKMRTT